MNGDGWVPRTVVFAGKAASAYHMAKQIVHLIHDVARVVNGDPRVGDKLKVVFLPNYSVSLAEVIIPAADLSEQISTAGTEASGTGNMKFALNGALTIGTWDGANIEMAQAFGPENMFVFGLRADAVARIKSLGYDPRVHVEQNPTLRAVLDAIGGGAFSHGESDRYRGVVDSLLHRDTYMLLADFADYVAAQSRVDALYRDPAAWAAHGAAQRCGHGAVLDRPHGPRLRRQGLVADRRAALNGRTTQGDRMLSDADVQALVEARHGDPFSRLGLHATPTARCGFARCCRGPPRLFCTKPKMAAARSKAARSSRSSGATPMACGKPRCRGARTASTTA